MEFVRYDRPRGRICVKRYDLLYKVIRDVIFLLGGVSGIAYQQVTGKVDGLLLMAYLVLLGVPGAAGLLALRQPSTPGVPSQSPPSSSPLPLPSPSGGGEP
jgi:hypothetical protein